VNDLLHHDAHCDRRLQSDLPRERLRFGRCHRDHDCRAHGVHRNRPGYDGESDLAVHHVALDHRANHHRIPMMWSAMLKAGLAAVLLQLAQEQGLPAYHPPTSA
jgi:hypothetical protein